jgi:membrane protein
MTDWLRNVADAMNRWLDRRRSTRILRGAVMGVFADDVLHYAGSMAYFAVLSLVNLFILGVVVASFVVGEGTGKQFVVDQAVRALPLASADVANLIDRAAEARGGVTVIGLVLLAWSALGVFGAVSGGITHVFSSAPHRAFWKERLVGVILLALTGIVAVASVLLGLVTHIIEKGIESNFHLPGLSVLLAVVAFLVPLGLVFVSFLVIYRVVPTRRVAWRDAIAGAAVAGVLWTVLRVGFTFFATQVARYDTVFGPIGTAVGLLVFLYFSSVVLLLGAEVVRASTAEPQVARHAGSVVQPDPRDVHAQTPG